MTESEAAARLPLRDLDRPAEPSLPTTAVGAVGPGATVTLHFSLLLDDSDQGPQIIDSNYAGPPVSFVVGDGNLLPGFEQALFGKCAGDQIDTVIAAAQAFGVVNADNQQRFPRYQFPPDLGLSENLLVEFADVSGYKQAGRIMKIGLHEVEIDFNHPLAGRDIRFTALIHQVAVDEKPHHE
jgi:FKBP-type peptidyl-prolyl cis-trans isomerase SlpA